MDSPRHRFYEIRIDRERNLLALRFSPKFWDPSVVDSLFDDIATAMRTLAAFGEVRVLVERRNAVLQSAEVIAKLQDMLSNHSTARIAFVAEGALARMQTKRLQMRDGIRLFSSIAAAEAWLMDDADRGTRADAA